MYSASELLAIAVRIEENGERFYRHLADRTGEAEVQTILYHLADQETEHGRLFASMQEGLEDSSAPLEEYEGEQEAYIRSCADQVVFTFDEAELAAMDPAEAIRFAIHREGDSILFYTELKKILPSRHHTLLGRIIAEEKQHFTRLSGLLASYRGG